MAGLFGRKQTITNTENKIGALRIQSSSQGLPIALVFGKTRVPANLIWYGDFTAVPHTSSTTTGGKGGGGTTTQSTSYTYTTGVIFGLMEGPSANGSNFIGTVWSNKDVSNATKLGLSQFSGSYTQTAWSYLVSNHANQALGYRGLAYAANSAFDLGTSDGLPNLSFECIGLVGTSDVNPADVITQVLTSDKFGAGWPTAQLASLSDFSAYCNAAAFLVSPAYIAQTPASQIVSDLCQVGNAAPVWSEGQLKIKTYADETVGSYTPDLTVQYALGYSDFLAAPGEPPVRINRKKQADAYNNVQIECLDRSNQYNTTVVEAKDQWNIDTYGLRTMQPITAHAICDANVGRSVAQTIMQRQLYVRNTYEFTVGWRYCRLEPMDIVSLTDAFNGLNAKAVRITEITENENGELAMVAEDLTVGVSTPGSYAAQSSSGSTPANGVDPGDTYAPVVFQPPLALSLTPQVWIGAQGGANWGGAQVWVSTDGGSSYAMVGQITNPARYGTLTANFPTGVDPDTTDTLSVDLTTSRGTLTSGTTTDADSLNTLSYVDGELVAYSGANLTSAYHYDLGTYLRRGQAGSSIAAHLTGATFMRLDDAVAQFDVSASLYGTTLYIKLLSYNTTGGALQSLSAVTATTFNLVAQAATGNGYSFIADRSSTTVANPGAGKMRFNNAAQSSANQVVFNSTTNDGANMVSFFASVGSAGYMEIRDHADTTKWASYTLTSSNAPAGYQIFGVTYKAGGAEIPTGDTVLVSFSPTPPTGVTQVGLVLPAALFNVTTNSVTTTGNLTASLVTQNAATFFAGPLTGNAAAPTFRALAASDFNATGANSSTVLYGDFTWRVPAGGNSSGNGTVLAWLDVKASYGGKGDGKYVTDGVANSTAAVTSATANFAVTDVGKLIEVDNNATVFSTTIAAYVAANQVTLTANVPFSTSNCRVTFGSDDTAAIQAAINAGANTPGGPNLLFQTGIWCVGGALQDTSRSNAQILLPSANAVSGKEMTVTFRGVTPPPAMPSVVGSTPLPDGLVVIRGMLNTASGNSPAMVGGWGPSGSFNNFTFVNFASRDILYRMPRNPTLTALDLSHVAGADIDTTAVDCGNYQIQGLTQPTSSTSFGLRLPGNGNGAYTRLGVVNVIGFYNGYEFGEHSNGFQVNAWGCMNPFNFIAADHASYFTRLMAVHCNMGITVTGDHYFRVAEYNVEHAAAGSWLSTTYDINDASNKGHGDIFWHQVTANVGVNSTFTVNGAANLRRFQLDLAFDTDGTLAANSPNRIPTQDAVKKYVDTAVAGTGNSVSAIRNTQTANYTLTLTDFNAPTMVEANSANGIVFKIPSHANVAAANMVTVLFARLGNGAVTISSEANVVVHNSSSNTLRAQYSIAGATQRAPDEWYLFGDTT